MPRPGGKRSRRCGMPGSWGRSSTSRTSTTTRDPVTYLVRSPASRRRRPSRADGGALGRVDGDAGAGGGRGRAPSAGGLHAHALDDLADVDAGRSADGHVLTYDSGTGEWGNEPGGRGRTTQDGSISHRARI